MPKNFADALGETLQDTGKNLLPFIQLMREQRAESSAAQFERDLKLSKFQLDVDQLDMQRMGLDERRHESRLAMFRYMNPNRAPQPDPNSIEGLIARHIAGGGKTTDPYVVQLTSLAGNLADSKRRETPSESGAGMAHAVMGDITKATAAFNSGKLAWDKSSLIQEGQGKMGLGAYPGDPVDTLGMLQGEYEYAKQFGQEQGFSDMIRSNPRLSPYQMRIENAVKQTPMGASRAAVEGLRRRGFQMSPDEIGRSMYDDWDTLSPAEKQAIIEQGFPKE